MYAHPFSYHRAGSLLEASKLLQQLGEEARLSPTPEVAYAATQVMELAAQIRLQCLVALAKLSLEYAMPSLQVTPAVLVPKYQSLRENVRRLGALQPQDPAPLATAI